MSQRLREWRLSRARAARTEKPAAPLDPAEKFAGQAHNLDAVRKSVEDAAAVSAGFWLSYLFVLFYIGIAAGGVTHKDLLLESPVKLPFLSDVPLPLIAFFFLAPIIFIVFHAYTLVHFVMLAAKVGAFDTELRAHVGDAPETRDAFRRQLPSNIFVQFLAGPRDIRKGLLGLLLKAIAWVSLVIGPVLLLLLIQVRFLPYHLEWLTWAHRLAILADVILLWLLWPAVLNSRSKLMWRFEHTGEGWRSRLALTGRYIAGFTACLVPIGLAFTAAAFPGERMDEWVGERQWIPPNRLTAWLGQEDSGTATWTSFHNLLFNSRRDAAGAWNKSVFATTLDLSNFDALQAAKIDNSKKLDAVEHTLDLAYRNLEYASFLSADLRKVDFDGAQLRGAQLDGARLQGALLNRAQLQGATLVSATLQGASLDNAQLQGASLVFANLAGASLQGTELQGASLTHAKLQGASLLNAELQGAALDDAELQGSNLGGANLQAASLAGAQFQGAWLQFAQLQGASLERTKLAGAALVGTFVWRARFSPDSIEGSFPDKIRWDSKYFHGLFIEESWTEGSYLALKKLIEEKLVTQQPLVERVILQTWKENLNMSLAAGGRDAALKRIEILDPNKPFEFEAEVPKWKEKIEAAEKFEPRKYEKALIGELKALACSGDADAIHVVRGFLEQGFRIKQGLVEAILKPDCPVSATLTDADKAALEKLKKEASGAH